MPDKETMSEKDGSGLTQENEEQKGIGMNSLDHAREVIKNVDIKMAALFEERMDAVREVAAYKQERGLPVLDEAQETRVIARNSGYIKTPELVPYYEDYIKATMKVSRDFQHHLLKDKKVAYSGVEGAFAHIASRKIFPDARQISYDSFASAYQAVLNNECEFAVLPIENSYAGEVGQVLDLMYSGPLYVNGVYDLHISQNLLGIPGAELSDIRTVVSHPQALGQCAGFIKSRGLETLQASNTAKAAQAVAEKQDKSLAAIASRETAALYGLQILAQDINESNDNCTRFAVFSRIPSEQLQPSRDREFILIFTLNSYAGALARAVDIIGKYGFNMKVLRSRPVKTTPWQYYFYVEAEGSEESEEGRKMMTELREYCAMIKICGHFYASISLKDNETL